MNRIHPLFSIITVVRNGDRCIEKTFQSIFIQSYKNIEAIVIDGGSTDSTIDLIRKYGRKISYWVSEPDGGTYDAMNKALRAARGDYLYFLNCGDYFADSSVLEQVAKHIEANSPDILYGDICTIDEEGICIVHKTEMKSDFEFYKKTICHQAIFSSRKVFEVVGEFDTSYRLVADRDWLLRALKKYKFNFSYVNVPIAVFDRSGASSKRRALLRMEDMKLSFIYFGYRFYPYLLKQILDKVMRIGEDFATMISVIAKR